MADVIQRTNVRMIQCSDRPRLALETFAQSGVAPDMVGQHFDRDGAIQSCIARSVHLAHPAGTEDGHNLVRSESDTGSKGRHRLLEASGLPYNALQGKPRDVFPAGRPARLTRCLFLEDRGDREFVTFRIRARRHLRPRLAIG
jgi:hypothetical protein